MLVCEGCTIWRSWVGSAYSAASKSCTSKVRDRRSTERRPPCKGFRPGSFSWSSTAVVVGGGGRSSILGPVEASVLAELLTGRSRLMIPGKRSHLHFKVILGITFDTLKQAVGVLPYTFIEWSAIQGRNTAKIQTSPTMFSPAYCDLIVGGCEG